MIGGGGLSGVGSGVVGSGVVGSGVAGSGIAGSGVAGSGIAGSGVAGSGIAGSGVVFLKVVFSDARVVKLIKRVSTNNFRREMNTVQLPRGALWRTPVPGVACIVRIAY
ncbi:MAG: hypothetical protein ACI9G1_000437 [Pirellulaceae bacterium]